MSSFYVLLAVIAVIPIVTALKALFSAHTSSGNTLNETNIEITKLRIREIDQQLNADDREIAELELHAELAGDYQAQSENKPVEKKIPFYWNVLIVILIPICGFYTYSKVGHPEFARSQQRSIQAENLDIDQLLAQLELKISENPTNPKGWVLAGRTYMGLGEYAKANAAYAVLNKLVVGNPEYLVAWSDATIMATGNLYTDEIRSRINAALAIDPLNINGLWIGALGEQSLGEHEKSIHYFHQLLPLVEVEGDEASIERIKTHIAQSEANLPARQTSNEEPKSNEKTEPQSANNNIAVSVSMASNIRAQVKGSDIVFIIAKAKSGPKAPLAVLKYQVSDLPVTTQLTADMSMVDGLDISKFDEIVVTARISLSGNARAAKGDYMSEASLITSDDETRMATLLIHKKIE